MNEMIHTPPSHAEPIYKWYKRAQIDYVDHYIRLYISYNAWYREVTGTLNDRQALAQLKKRVVIWEDYRKGRSMQSLRVYMDKLVDVTLKEPLGKTLHWSGSVENPEDWRSLIEYWYQVRCMLVHGSAVHVKYVWLAFETLDVFMGEIIERMNKAFAMHELQYKTQYSQTINKSKYSELRERMHARYFTSPDLWQVDMRHAEDL